MKNLLWCVWECVYNCGAAQQCFLVQNGPYSCSQNDRLLWGHLQKTLRFLICPSHLPQPKEFPGLLKATSFKKRKEQPAVFPH